MIRIFVEQKPDGWRYEWADIPEQRDTPTIPDEWAPSVAVYQGVDETFEGAVSKVQESIRSRYPKGELQGDTAARLSGGDIAPTNWDSGGQEEA